MAKRVISRKFLRVIAVATAIAVLTGAGSARPGDFDCSVIYDEYDSLMGKDFLLSPGEFVAGYEGWFSEQAFSTLQRGGFALHPERGESGVIVFRTNHNRHGKLLYYWTDPLVDGRRYLVISEAAWYARVADGAGLELFSRLRANSGRGIDLDTLALVELVLEDDGRAEDQGENGESGLNPFPGSSVVELIPGDETQVVEAIVTEIEDSPTSVIEGQGGVELLNSSNRSGLALNDDEGLDVNTALSSAAADVAVLLDTETGIYYVSAINGATLFFPTESLCATSALSR
jgi:hypothetical protein